MKIPIANRLRKRLQVDIASLQDEVVDIIYDLKPNAVLHGGTALWRCYGGNRFSEDLDFYFKVEGNFKDIFSKNLESRGLTLKKYKKTENVIFSKIIGEDVEIRLEVMLKEKKESVVRAYEKADGTNINILTLTEKELLFEKMNAYKNRRLIRDIYDVFHLSSMVELEENEKKEIREFIEEIKNVEDEENLKTLIYSGAVPTFKQMVEGLKRRLR